MSLILKYFDIPEGVENNMIASSVDGQNAMGLSETLKEGFSDDAWATLENLGWPLDGTRNIIAEAPMQNVGWWSKEISGDDGRFATPPIIRIMLGENEKFSVPGITIRFWPSMSQWCSEIRVTWYYATAYADGSGYTETVIAQASDYPTGPEWTILKNVKDFNLVEIELLSTNIPGQFAKLQQIQIGHTFLFSKAELARVLLLNEVDPSSCELSVDTLTVDIYDRQGRTLRPQKRQPVQLYHNGHLVASHYLISAERKGHNAYTFHCQSAIGQLDGTFLGGVYDNQMLYGVLEDLLRGFSWEKTSIPAAQTITGYLPVCTRREALQQIAFAVGAVVSTSGDGTIRLSKPPETASGAFTGKEIFPGAKLHEEPPVTAVCVTAHQYTQSEETETLLEDVMVSGTRLFTFDQPHHGYEWENPPQGANMETGHNWVKITVGDIPTFVTITAKKYIHTISVYERVMGTASDADKENVVRVADATLVHPGNVESVTDRLSAYCKNNDTLTQNVVVSGQNVGDIVESVNPWNSITTGYITDMESEFTGSGRTATVTIRGYEKTLDEAEVLKI